MRRILFIFFVPLFLAQASIAGAMTFRVKKVDMRPFDLIYYIYAMGDVEKGDSDRLLTAIRAENIPQGTRLEIYFNSRGGSLAAGLELGRAVTALSTIGLSANTNVGSETADPLNPAEGECSSACVFAYLGGEYRHLSQKSRLGVHQFFMDEGKAIDPATALAAGQIISAEIVEFVRKTGADVSIFKIMASVAPGEIFYVPHDKLRELRVIIETVMEETWTFELLEGLTYLKIWQLSRFGENKMLLSCIKGQLIGMAFVQPPQNHTVGVLPHTVGVFVDGNLETVPSHGIMRPPAFQGKFVNALFSVDQNLAIKMLTARSVGVAIQPPNKDIFIGFQIDTTKGKDKLASMIGSCARKPMETSAAPSAPLPRPADALPMNGRTFPPPARFNDYRVATDFHGPNATPILDSREKLAYRTRLRAAARSKPNFAGRWFIVTWGCGTACSIGAAVDLMVGTVVFLPGPVSGWGAVDAKFDPIERRLHSSLIILSGRINERGPLGAHYFSFDGISFKYISSILMTDDFRSQLSSGRVPEFLN